MSIDTAPQSDASVVPEDRGLSVWIWTDLEHGVPTFERPHGAFERFEVSAPRSYELRPSPICGVLLTHVCGRGLGARRVLELAAAGLGGFRVRKREMLE